MASQQEISPLLNHPVEQSLQLDLNLTAPAIPTILDSIRTALTVDLSQPIILPALWHEKTKILIDERWQNLPLISRRSIAVLNQLGNLYPQCASLEDLTRQVGRMDTLDVTQIARRFTLFQEKSKRRGSFPILQTGTFLPMILPLVHTAPKDEREVLINFLSLIPPLVVATISSQKPTKKDDSDAMAYYMGEVETVDHAPSGQVKVDPWFDVCGHGGADADGRYWSQDAEGNWTNHAPNLHHKPDNVDDY